MNTNDENSLKLSLLDFAKQIVRDQLKGSALASMDMENFDNVVTAVKTWLNTSKNTHWLLIYNNYNNPRLPSNKDRSALDLCQFLPKSNHGSIIIITQSSKVTLSRRIQLKKLVNIKHSLKILSNTFG